MRLTSFRIENGVKIGLYLEEKIVDLSKAYAYLSKDTLPSEMITFLETGDTGLRKAKIVERAFKKEQETIKDAIFNTRKIQILAPIPRTRKNIVCLGLNYADHARETSTPIPSNPIFFTKPPTSIIGPEDAIVLPKSSKEVDYEIELAFVFGKKGKNISEEEAYEYIAGYTVFNDVSARDLQSRHKQWFKGKSLDTFAPMGPYLVTKDEIPDPQNLEIEMKLNGETMQKSNTNNLIFKIPDLVKYLSMDMTVEPGDVVATGTPSGVGFTRKPSVFLKNGDILEASVERVGTLRNRVTL